MSDHRGSASGVMMMAMVITSMSTMVHWGTLIMVDATCARWHNMALTSQLLGSRYGSSTTESRQNVLGVARTDRPGVARTQYKATSSVAALPVQDDE